MTYKDALVTLDEVSFPKGLTVFQTLKVTYWSLFKKKKFYKFCEAVKKGKALNFAIKDVNVSLCKKCRKI